MIVSRSTVWTTVFKCYDCIADVITNRRKKLRSRDRSYRLVGTFQLRCTCCLAFLNEACRCNAALRLRRRGSYVCKLCQAVIIHEGSIREDYTIECIEICAEAVCHHLRSEHGLP